MRAGVDLDFLVARENRDLTPGKPCYIFSHVDSGACARRQEAGAPYLTRDDSTGFAPPPAFGPFRVLHQIGVGALGPVFRTYEPTRDRLVAVKVFRLDITPEQARALADELSRAAEVGLFHSSIVEPVAAGLEGTVAYRAEEYVAAESLDVAMRHYAPATVEKALPFITQLASAIDFAKGAGVGHGALHPRDIFVTPDEARATGFGVVDALERMGLRAPVRRPYSPPERIAGRPWNTSADVFSLGVIAFELLTGRRPSGLGDEIGPLTGATLGDRADEVRAVLVRAMHEDPARRYETALAFSAALANAAGVPEPAFDPAIPALGVSAKSSADPELRIAPTEPVDVLTELPLKSALSSADSSPEVLIQPDAEFTVEAAAAPSLTELTVPDAEHALDDFAAEPEQPSLDDSPREVARKVIAARKRQAKKPEKIVEVVADSETPSIIVPEAAPVAVALFEETRTEEGRTETAADTRPTVQVFSNESVEPTPPAIPTASPDVAAEVVEVAAPPVLKEVASRGLEAVEFEPARPELSERVVAVDEYRAREAAAQKPDRGWTRVPETPSPERHDRLLTPLASEVDSIDPEIQPPMFGEAGRERQRLEMLPLALVLGLGLVIGYAAGYVVGNRERPQLASAAADTQRPASPSGSSSGASSSGRPSSGPSSEVQAPTTGSSTPRAATEQIVAPGRTSPPLPSAPPSAAPTSGIPPARPPSTPAAAPRAATAGRLVVTSDPAKASVTINGRWRGRTPLTLDPLRFGNYDLRVVQPGYEVARERFALSADAASKTIDVDLRPVQKQASGAAPKPRASQTPPPRTSPPPPKPAPASVATKLAASTGELYVDSRPQGATVFVDGKEVGVTPLRIDGQRVGSHHVQLVLTDHQTWTTTTKVEAQGVARVSGSLERIRD